MVHVRAAAEPVESSQPSWQAKVAWPPNACLLVLRKQLVEGLCAARQTQSPPHNGVFAEPLHNKKAYAGWSRAILTRAATVAQKVIHKAKKGSCP